MFSEEAGNPPASPHSSSSFIPSRASLIAFPWSSPAIWRELFPETGSKLEGSAMQKNCDRSPIFSPASSTGSPRSFSAASQVAPQGAPLFTLISLMIPLRVKTSRTGAPNFSPYRPRQSCLERAHQVGGAAGQLLPVFFPEAITGIPSFSHRL